MSEFHIKNHFVSKGYLKRWEGHVVIGVKSTIDCYRRFWYIYIMSRPL